jgi:hypothetical protein
MGHRRLAKVLIAVALIIVVIPFGIRACQHRSGTAATTADAPISELPKDATNIEYYFPAATWPNTYYEFNTSESGYRSWVAGWQIHRLDPISKGPVSVYRYNLKKDESEILDIEDSLCTGWSEGDAGASLVYDLKTGRAYFHSHTR